MGGWKSKQTQMICQGAENTPPNTRSHEQQALLYASEHIESLESELTNYKLGFATANEDRERLEAQLAESLELLGMALSSFRCTQSPGSYSDKHWSNRAIKALAAGRGE
jgi:hypothetical protein